jgi:hypothetical protein
MQPLNVEFQNELALQKQASVPFAVPFDPGTRLLLQFFTQAGLTQTKPESQLQESDPLAGVAFAIFEQLITQALAVLSQENPAAQLHEVASLDPLAFGISEQFFTQARCSESQISVE